MNIKEQLLHKISNKTKPLGALGVLENIALQIGEIQNTLTPQIKNPQIVVFAADHGVAADGKVNPFPQAVTAQMVLNFVQGGAAINVFCKQNNIGLTVVDAGVNFDFEPSLPIVHAKIKKGTTDYTKAFAMLPQDVTACLEKGSEIVQTLFDKGCNTIGFGEMGIGNTSAASLIMSSILNIEIENCVGRGTGVNDEQLQLKINTLKEVYIHHQLQSKYNGTELLSKVGGFEIAMMVGAYVKAAELKMVIVVDGFIATAALLIAQEINKQILQHCIFAHTSGEQGHLKMLEKIGAKPLLNLGMRLGEGTGAALAIPLLQSAVAFLNEMASFESAGVDNRG
jgi:nicotinate-nucleotide--dimethylbenzimidazole phosphoribosyltransferase